MKGSARLVALAAASICFALAAHGARADGNAGNSSAKSTLTTVWSAPSTGDAGIKLLPLDAKVPVTTAYSPATVITGHCQDCQMTQQFTVAQATSICKMCACASPNVECVSWANLKHMTVNDMLQALPLGVGIRVVYNGPGKPDSGIEHLIIDQHTVLLPVTGLTGKSGPELNSLVKPVTGQNAQLSADGTELTFTVKDWWTVKQEKKFETLLASAGGKLAYTDSGK